MAGDDAAEAEDGNEGEQNDNDDRHAARCPQTLKQTHEGRQNEAEQDGKRERNKHLTSCVQCHNDDRPQERHGERGEDRQGVAEAAGQYAVDRHRGNPFHVCCGKESLQSEQLEKARGSELCRHNIPFLTWSLRFGVVLPPRDAILGVGAFVQPRS